MTMPVNVETKWSGSSLTMQLTIDLSHEITSATLKQTEKAVANAVVDELSKSPEFQKGIRDLAVKKIVEILSNGL